MWAQFVKDWEDTRVEVIDARPEEVHLKNQKISFWRFLSWALALLALCAIALAGIEAAQTRDALDVTAQYEKIAYDAIARYGEEVKYIVALQEENEELKAQIDALREPNEDAYDTEFGWDYDYVVRVVGAEARGEPIDGILAVCQCIQDTAERTGQTPEQVVKSGKYTRPVSRAVTDNMETVNECCLLVFLNGYKPYSEPIEYFYAFKNGYSAWHESQVFCYKIGGHRYFKAVGGDENA